MLHFWALRATALLGAALAAPVAEAAFLNLPTAPPRVVASDATLDYLTFGPDGDLSTFGAVVDSTEGVTLAGTAELSLGAGYALADPAGTATGGFDLFDANGLVLDGELARVGFSESLVTALEPGVLEFEFVNLGGPAASAFGPSVLMTVAFADPIGPNVFANLVDGTAYDASLSVAHVVPLPGAALLLASALAGLGIVRGTKRTANRRAGNH